ncbi:major facilitator superfamily domain-containing protein [Boeremia exigua]|uniref:major facilitator superfamily domain-containing protein n=1 Tax=Boeremia exigua TaxID=749465 RepID=UPI001E8DC342|nr:major facilitator superfamily domain-containing protein [Boeremia exigua]KAH6612181.1 major facilitator superfamily domain-containing protein [Boeremia exigua]
MPHTPFSNASSAEIDLIGTLAASLMTISAPLIMSGVRAYKPQTVACGVGLLCGIASILASFGQRLWHFQLSQGFLLGIATGMTLMPSLIIPPTWFDHRRGLAMGIVSAGTGIGGLVWVPAITAAVDHMGFRNTLRMTGALGAALLCFSGLFLDWEESFAQNLQNQVKETSAWTRLFSIPRPSKDIVMQRKFLAQALCTVFQSAAYYTPVFFTVAYAQSLGYSNQQGANLTAVSNACNAIGKISAGFAADRIGKSNAFFITTLLSAIASLGLWLPSSLLGTVREELAKNIFIGFTVLYGLSASAFISLFSPVLAETFGITELPRISGVMYMLQGLSALVGTPVAGLLISSNGSRTTSDNYLGMTVLVGGLMSAATLAVLWLRLETSVGRVKSDGV